MNGWQRLWRRGRMDAELERELRFHEESQIADLVARGLDPQEARRQARLSMGGVEQVREACRDARGTRLLEDFVQDVRYGVRMLLANKTFSTLAILSLALGIGANTAIFSFMDAIVLRSLPVQDPAALVTLAWHTPRPEFHGMDRHDDSYTDPNGGYVGGGFAYEAFELLRRDTSVFTTLFGYQGTGDLHLAIGDQAAIVSGEYVSGNYFTGLGVVPASGRLLGPDDDRAGAPAVAVISYGLSEARFGGPANATGRSILLDNVPFTVVGVTAAAFFGADSNAAPSVYVPLHANLLLQGDDAAVWYTEPGFDWIVPMARLRPGISAAQAQAALSPTFAAWRAATDPRPEKERPTLVVRPSAGGLDGLRRTYEKPLYILLGLVGLILAIACANIANLLLSRASARTREIAVRLGIGAARGRVLRQLLTESVLLSAIGGVFGIAFAVWGIRFLMLLLLGGRGDDPVALAVGLNWRVLGVVATITVMTGVLFGLAPALQSTRVDLISALKTARTRGSGDHRDRRISLGRLLIVSQIAITLLILIAAGLFLRTLSNLESIRLGFNPERLLTFQINPRQAGHNDAEIAALYTRLLSELPSVPGVRNVTVSIQSLLGSGTWGGVVTVPGGETKGSRIQAVGPAFFSTLEIPVLRGRAIEARDRPGAPYVAVVNEEFARIFFGTADPIGRHVVQNTTCPTCQIEIVGVVADTLYGRLRATTFSTAGPPPIIFLSFLQSPWQPIGRGIFELKTAGNPLGLVEAVRDIVRRADARVPMTQVKTQRALIDGEINQEVTFARLCTAFALLALAIACVGLYGTMSYAVARRTSEIGIRMALGAARAGVTWMVLREVLTLTAIGLAVSLPAALIASKVVESFLFGITRNDPLALGAAIATLAAATLIAGYLPARGAARIDPMVALRHE